jgi:hypothetical protein
MIDIENLLSSISDEDMAKIKDLAQNLVGNDKEKTMETEKNNFPIDLNTMNKIMSVMGKMGKDDYRTRLINDLKPMLSDDRQKKADEAVKFLQLMEILPLLRGMF